MDFDIGNLFYFIVLIIAAISGLFGKKKKQAPGGAAKPKGIFQQLEKQLEGLVDEAKTSVESIREELIPSERETVEAEQKSYETYMEESPLYSGLSEEYVSPYRKYEGIIASDLSEDEEFQQTEVLQGKEAEGAIHVLDLDEEEYPDYYEIIKEFNLSKAVVYSEILNRKDY